MIYVDFRKAFDCFPHLRLHPKQGKDRDPEIQLNGKRLRCVSHQRNLGVIVDETLKLNLKCAKAARNVNSLISRPHFPINYMERPSEPTWNTHSKPGDGG